MGSPLRILQITNRIPFPLNDGGNIATYNVTYYLNKAGHAVTLASLNTKKHLQDSSALSDIADVYDVTVDTTITPIGLLKGVFEKQPYNVKRFESEDFKQLLINILSQKSFDIIQVEGSYMAIYIDILRKYSQAKIILRSHNIEHEIWYRMSANELNFLKKWYFSMLSKKIKRFEDNTLHEFDGIVAITSRDEEYYKKQHYKGLLTTINAGANLEKFIPDDSNLQHNTICFLAGMDWLPNQQGLDWFLNEIWPRIQIKFPEVCLHIAGKSMSERYYKLGNEHVIVHGMVPDAIEYLQKYEIFIVPLLSGGGMRLKVVEGMALAKCIVSTTVGAEGVAYNKEHDIVIADSPEEWVEKISYLLENSAIRYKIGQNAHQLSQQKYNWKTLVDTFISVYNLALKVD
jgi:glycosyltransferase involved in cell wall biosynthesis